jgi:hypothetical protein
MDHNYTGSGIVELGWDQTQNLVAVPALGAGAGMRTCAAPTIGAGAGMRTCAAPVTTPSGRELHPVLPRAPGGVAVVTVVAVVAEMTLIVRLLPVVLLRAACPPGIAPVS